MEGKFNGSPFGDWSSLCQSLCFTFWSAHGLTLGGGVVTAVGVHPAWRCTSHRGVLPVGLGDGINDCHDAVILQKEGPFYFSLGYFRRSKLLFSKKYGFVQLDTAGYASN